MKNRPSHKSRSPKMRTLRFEAMELRQPLASDLCQHNSLLPEDVNGDTSVSPIDALTLINKLNNASSLIDTAILDQFYMNVNNDGVVSVLDALTVINRLNTSTIASATPATETTSSTTDTSTTTSDSSTTDTSGETKGTTDTSTDAGSESTGTTSGTTTGTTNSPCPQDSTHLVATLTGTNGATASFKYASSTVDGVAQQKLVVTVKGLAANSTLDVIVGGVTIGEVATDAQGAGTLVLKTTPGETTDLAIPENFPTIEEGTAVAIGTDLTGSLATLTPTQPGHGHRFGHHGHWGGHHGGPIDEADETEFNSLMKGTGSQIGFVEFETGTRNRTMVSKLRVSVNSLTPNATLDVTINGVVVGQIVTDANGHGDLDLSSSPKRTNQLPLPANFPTITAGTIVAIGTELSGTFVDRNATTTTTGSTSTGTTSKTTSALDSATTPVTTPSRLGRHGLGHHHGLRFR